MHLVVNQVVKFEHVHVTNRCRTFERISAATIKQIGLCTCRRQTVGLDDIVRVRQFQPAARPDARQERRDGARGLGGRARTVGRRSRPRGEQGRAEGPLVARSVRGDGAQILIEADATDPSAANQALAAAGALPTQALAHDLKGAMLRQAPSAPPCSALPGAANAISRAGKARRE